MSATLDNAVAVIRYQDIARAGGYWCTRHHAEHIEPGDLVRPVVDQYPRRVDSIRISRGATRITDEYGVDYCYRRAAEIRTAPQCPVWPRRRLGDLGSKVWERERGQSVARAAARLPTARTARGSGRQCQHLRRCRANLPCRRALLEID